MSGCSGFLLLYRLDESIDFVEAAPACLAKVLDSAFFIIGAQVEESSVKVCRGRVKEEANGLGIVLNGFVV